MNFEIILSGYDDYFGKTDLEACGNDGGWTVAAGINTLYEENFSRFIGRRAINAGLGLVKYLTH